MHGSQGEDRGRDPTECHRATTDTGQPACDQLVLATGTACAHRDIRKTRIARPNIVPRGHAIMDERRPSEIPPRRTASIRPWRRGRRLSFGDSAPRFQEHWPPEEEA